MEKGDEHKLYRNIFIVVAIIINIIYVITLIFKKTWNTQQVKPQRWNFKDDLISYYRMNESKITVAPLVEVSLEKLYVLPPMWAYKNPSKFGPKYDNILRREKIGFSQLFLSNSGERYSNIYLTADAGLGKTSLLQKITMTWCQAYMPLSSSEDEYEDDELDTMRNFDLLFLLNLRDYQSEHKCRLDDMIIDMVSDVCSRSSLYTKEFIRMLLREKKCLIISDGLSEWVHPKTCRQSPAVPHNNFSNRCTVLTTSRTLNMKAIGLSRKHIDRHVTVSKLDSTTREQLETNAVRVLDERHLKLARKDISNFHQDVRSVKMDDFLSIPYILLQLIFLFFGGFPIGTSICEIYSYILEFKLQCLNSNNVLEAQVQSVVPNCMKTKETCVRYINIIMKLGKLAFFNFFYDSKKTSFIFDREVVDLCISLQELDICLKVGLLCRTKECSRLAEKQHAFFFQHKWEQEFLSAIYLASEWQDKVMLSTFLKSNLSLSSICEMSNVFVFVSGINPIVYGSISNELTKVVETDPVTCRYRTYVDYDDYCTDSRLMQTYQSMQVECLQEIFRNDNYMQISLRDVLIDMNNLNDDSLTALRLIMHVDKGNLVSFNLPKTDEKEAKIDDFIQSMNPEIFSCLKTLKVYYDNNPIWLANILNTSARSLEIMTLSGLIFKSGITSLFELKFLHTLSLALVTLTHSNLNCLYACISQLTTLNQVKLKTVNCYCHIAKNRDCVIDLDLRSLTKLKMLQLSRAPYTNLQVCPVHLEKLVLQPRRQWKNASASENILLWECLHESPVLSELVLCNMDISCIATLGIHTLKQLKVLKFRGNDMKNTALCFSSEMTKLERVKIESVSMTSTSWRELFRSFFSLTHRVVMKFDCSSGELETILDEINTSLKFQIMLLEMNSKIPNRRTFKVQTHMAPEEILRMDKSDFDIFRQALEEGENNVFNIRVMIVGHLNVGKTVLTKRFLHQDVDITIREPTEGIDVHVKKMTINLATGEWRENEDDAGTRYEKRKRNAVYQYEDDSSDSSDDDTSVYSDDDNSDHLNDGSLTPSTEQNQHVYRKQEQSYGKLPHAEDNIKLAPQPEAEVSIWDFAGHYAFYDTHQVFMSWRTIYLLVTDLSKHPEDFVEDECYVDSIGRRHWRVSEFASFWLNAINECTGDNRKQSGKPSQGPPVILVGTFADKLQDTMEGDERLEKIKQCLREKNCTASNLVDKHFVINNKSQKDGFSDLRETIVEIAKKQRYWGERIPARWIDMEIKLSEMETRGIKILEKKILEDMINDKSLPIPTLSELNLYLKFHHETGNLVHFSEDNALKETIVLDPQWLIDAFKRLNPQREFLTTRPEIFNNWIDFDKYGILPIPLIHEMWKEDWPSRTENGDVKGRNKSEFSRHSADLLNYLQKLGLLAKPHRETKSFKNINKFYFAPSFLKETVPYEFLKPADNEKTTSKLCFEAKSGFLPSAVFNKLLASCIAKFPLVWDKKTNQYLLFCGCGIFFFKHGLLQHKLYILFNENAIQIWLSREREAPDGEICRQAKQFVEDKIKKICFEHFLKFPQTSFILKDNEFKLKIKNAESPVETMVTVMPEQLKQIWFPECARSNLVENKSEFRRVLTSRCKYNGTLMELEDGEKNKIAESCGRNTVFGVLRKIQALESEGFAIKVAVKRIRVLDSKDKDHIQQKISASRFHHPFILTIYAIFEKQDVFYFVSPYCENGNLQSRLKPCKHEKTNCDDRCKPLNEAQRIRIAYHIASAIHFLHTPFVYEWKRLHMNNKETMDAIRDSCKMVNTVDEFKTNVKDKLKELLKEYQASDIIKRLGNQKICDVCMINQVADELSTEYHDNCRQKMELCTACDYNSNAVPLTCFSCEANVQPFLGAKDDWGALLIAGHGSGGETEVFRKDVQIIKTAISSGFGPIREDKIETILSDENSIISLRSAVQKIAEAGRVNNLLIYVSCHGAREKIIDEVTDFKCMSPRDIEHRKNFLPHSVQTQTDEISDEVQISLTQASCSKFKNYYSASVADASTQTGFANIFKIGKGLTAAKFTEELSFIKTEYCVKYFVIILDRCFPPKLPFQCEHWIQFNACRSDEPALAMQQSIFTKYFHQALKGEKCSSSQDGKQCYICANFQFKRDDYLSFAYIFEYVKRHLKLRNQTPEMVFVGSQIHLAYMQTGNWKTHIDALEKTLQRIQIGNTNSTLTYGERQHRVRIEELEMIDDIVSNGCREESDADENSVPNRSANNQTLETLRKRCQDLETELAALKSEMNTLEVECFTAEPSMENDKELTVMKNMPAAEKSKSRGKSKTDSENDKELTLMKNMPEAEKSKSRGKLKTGGKSRNRTCNLI